MRPKKKILLLCPDDVAASVMSFQLRTWLFDVTAITNEDEAVAEANDRDDFDLVILMPALAANRRQSFLFAVDAIDHYQMARGLATRIYDPKNLLGDLSLDICVPSLVSPYTSSVGQLKEAIKDASSRRRGPRKVVAA